MPTILQPLEFLAITLRPGHRAIDTRHLAARSTASEGSEMSPVTSQRTRGLRRVRHGSDQRGIALPAVLTTLVVVTMLSGVIGDAAMTAISTETIWNKRTRADWILAAGLNRAVKALVTPGDPMREALFKRKGIIWTFSGEAMQLRMENESEKLDVNSSDARLVAGVLARSGKDLSGQDLASASARIQDARSRHILLTSPEALLPVDKRFGSGAEKLRRLMTAYSGQPIPARNLDNKDDDAEHLDASLSDQVIVETTGPGISRPIYNLSASLMNTHSIYSNELISKSITIILSVNDQKTFRLIAGNL